MLTLDGNPFYLKLRKSNTGQMKVFCSSKENEGKEVGLTVKNSKTDGAQVQKLDKRTEH